MGKFIDLTNKKFGRLLVVSREADYKWQGLYKGKTINRVIVRWKCKCDCGSIVLVNSQHLKNGHSTSCGCYLQEVISKKPFESIYNYLVYCAKKRDISVGLTYEEFLEFTKINKCFYCYAPIKWNEYNRKKGSQHNIDRRNNSLGYSKDNCVVCCVRCNRGKGERFSETEWFRMTEPFRKGEL